MRGGRRWRCIAGEVAAEQARSVPKPSSIFKDSNFLPNFILYNMFYAPDAGSLLHVEGEPGREVSDQLGEERPTRIGRVRGTIRGTPQTPQMALLGCSCLLWKILCT